MPRARKYKMRWSICEGCYNWFEWKHYPNNSRMHKGRCCSRRCFQGMHLGAGERRFVEELDREAFLLQPIMDVNGQAAISHEDMVQPGVMSRWMGRGDIGHILNASASKIADVITRLIEEKYEEQLPEIRKRDRNNWKQELRTRLRLRKDVEFKLRLLRASIRLQIRRLEKLL